MKDEVELRISPGRQGQARRYDCVVRIVGHVIRKVILNNVVIFLYLFSN